MNMAQSEPTLFVLLFSFNKLKCRKMWKRATQNYLSFAENFNVTNAIGGKNGVQIFFCRTLEFFFYFIFVFSFCHRILFCACHTSLLSVVAHGILWMKRRTKKKWNCGQMSVSPTDIDNVSGNVEKNKIENVRMWFCNAALFLYALSSHVQRAWTHHINNRKFHSVRLVSSCSSFNMHNSNEY